MAFNIIGTSGNDTLVAPSDQGTVRGLEGNDSIHADLDELLASALVLGGPGHDTILVNAALATITGGDSSLDGNDSIHAIAGGFGFILGNGGADTITASAHDTLVGGFGSDLITTFAFGGGGNIIFGNEGNDTIDASPGTDTVFAGQGNDSVIAPSGAGDFRLNENNDTFYARDNTSALTVVGGNDSADGADSIWTGDGNDVILGNGGNDTIIGGEGNNVLVGGAGADFVLSGDDLDFIFGNESNDTVISGKGPDTVFGGQGNDSIVTGLVLSDDGFGNDSILGNEGSDRIIAGAGADTISGGANNDVFIYEDPADDGSSGGSVEFINDLNWAQDGFAFAWSTEFVAVTSPGGAGNLTQAAANALLAAWQQNGSADVNVAAVFTFQGRTYLVSDSNLTHNGAFSNNDDILIDITGATGSVNANALNAI